MFSLLLEKQSNYRKDKMMRHVINEQEERLFYAISTICGYITDRNCGSEVGGAYDLARHIQLAIQNVLGENEEDDGSMIWKLY